MSNQEKLQYYIVRKEKLMAALNRNEFIQSDWVDFINDSRKDGMIAMSNDMEKRYVYYLKKKIQGANDDF